MNVPFERFEILKIRAYLLFFIGITVSYLGTGMQFLANSWLVLEMTNSGYSVAIILVCTSVPGIFLSPVIGVIVDRYDRRWVCILTDLIRGIILLAVPVLWWFDLLQVWHLYAMSFLVAVGDQVYNPASSALVREIVPKEQLLQANSSTQMAGQTGALLGTGLGGLIIAIFSPVVVMLVNAVSFFISAFCALGMRKGIVAPSASGKAKGFGAFFGQLREGVKYIDKHRNIIMLYVMVLFLVSTFRTINVLLAPFAKDVLEVGAVGFGIIDAAFAIGAIFGAFYLPIITRKFGEKLTMSLMMGAMGLSTIWFALSQNLWMAVIGYLGIGLCFQVRTLYLTTAQHSIDLDYQGRVHSVFNTFFSVVSLGIYLLMGYLGEAYSERWLYIFQGMLMILGMLIAFSVLYRNQKEKVEENVYESV